MTPSPRVAARRLVGRDQLLATASTHLAALDGPGGGLLLLSGDPGIGKTRLAEEIVAVARGRGARVAWAAAWQGEGAPALWPWVQILRQLDGTEDALSRFSTDSPEASASACFAQSEAVVEIVRGVTPERPLVIVLDDLHWVDAASIRVLCFVASAIRDVSCLLVGTYRSDELEPPQIAALAHVGTNIAVPGLSDADAAALLRSAVGETISPAAVEAVVQRSGGNPLFVWEFGQLMAQSGRLDVAPAAVPEAVAAVIERRLARLSEAAVAVLRAAAVTGDPFSIDAIARVGRHDLSEAAVGLEAAAAVGLLVRDDQPGVFRFNHDLVREVVAAGIEPIRRTELHRHAAALFEGRLAHDPSLHAVVADHLEQGGPEEAEAAATHWEEAAQWARGVLAWDDAARSLGRASRIGSTDPHRRAALLFEEGEVLLLAGELDEARTRFLESADLARAIGAPDLLARAVLGVGTGPTAWEVPLGSPEQTDRVLAALSLLPEESAELRSLLLGRLAVTAATPQTMATAQARASEALRLAGEVGDPALIARALAAENDAIAGPDHTMTRRSNADTIVELAVAAGDPVLELLGYRFRIVADLEVGDLASVDRTIAAFATLAGQLRQPLVSWYVPLFSGMRALLAGDVLGASRHHQEVSVAAEVTGSQNAMWLAATLLFAIDVTRGNRQHAVAWDELVDLAPEAWATYAAGLAMYKLLVGESDRARELLLLHAGDGFAGVGEDSERLATLVMFGRVAEAVDEVGAMARVYDLLSPHAGLWAVDGIAAACWGPIELELGRLALALGRVDQASGHLVAARQSAERGGATLFAAEAAALAERSGAADLGPVDHHSSHKTGVFRREGQFWLLAYGGRTVRMKDAKGLGDLSQLIAEPGREIHVLDLAGRRRDAADRPVSAGGDLGELLDTRARAEYRRRLAELEDEVAETERAADLGRAEKARAERDFIVSELSSALGIAGRPRRTGDPVERARKAVTARIRLTIGRIDSQHPALARHLTNSVRTGAFCVYEPEITVEWVMDDTDVASPHQM